MLTRHGAWTRLEMRLPESAFAPCGFAAGDTNLYRYVGNAPTNATDPSGLQPPKEDQFPRRDAVYPPNSAAKVEPQYPAAPGKNASQGLPAAPPATITLPDNVYDALLAAYKKSFVISPPAAAAAAWVGSANPVGSLGNPAGIAVGLAPGYAVENGGSVFAEGPGKPLVVAPAKKAGGLGFFFVSEYPLPGKGQTWWAVYHTHPYPFFLGGFTRVPHSGGDIANFVRQEHSSEYSIVMSGDAIYAISRPSKAIFGGANIEDFYATVYNKHPGGTEESAEAAVIATTKHWGLHYYKAVAPPKGAIPKTLKLVVPGEK